MQIKENVIIFRIIANVVIFASVFIAPFWLTAVLAIAALFVFPRYYEIIFFGFVCDALYLPAFGNLIMTPITFFSIGAYVVSVFIKPRLRMFI